MNAMQVKKEVEHLLERSFDSVVEGLVSLLEIPSVSTLPEYRDDIYECAQAVANLLTGAGCQHVEFIATEGNPVVYGELKVSGEAPTVMVYGHYDVQPPGDESLWHMHPFEPQVRNGAIWARGASDNKGQFFIHVKAVEFLNRLGALPCNVKFVIEGEEEVGSRGLSGLVQNGDERLRGDVLVVSDTGMPSEDKPAITVALRGICYFLMDVYGPARELHSGEFGGGVCNPVVAALWLLSQIYDAREGKILVPGFYSRVRELDEEWRRRVAFNSWNREEVKATAGVEYFYSERGFLPEESATLRPSFDINGICGGYTGKGSKTVIPTSVHVKFSLRLVADQKWREVAQMVEEFIRQRAPQGVTVELKTLHGGDPVMISPDFWGYKAAVRALRDVYGVEPVPVASGGSIPVLAEFGEKMGMVPVMVGFGLRTDNIHAPNEHFRLLQLRRGIVSAAVLYHYLAEEWHHRQDR